jgi:carboxypeptidase family protein/TonB-dependent receptor-like protein
MTRHTASRRNYWKRLSHAIFAGVIVFASVKLDAQALYGSLVGNVVDETGAIVPGATVTITQKETNQTREQATPENGAYSFPNLAPGTYDIVVTLPGFKTFSSRDIAVRIGAIVRVDARLALGTLEESVVVTGEAAILQADSAALQSVTTAQALENLPINGRSYQSLLTLTPGVAQPNYFQTGGINNPSRSMSISVNGQPNTNTAFRLDGMSVTNQWIPFLQAYSPGIEAIETVNIVTSNFEADQGMAGGAAVNVQVKSGTNSLRGSAFEYFEHAKLRSRNYFLPASSEKPKGTKNIYGGTIGGPIKPNKLFYFFSLETTDSRAVGGPFVGSSALLLSLPPTEFRTGNFSSTGVAIYDPLTGNPNGTGRTPFAFANCPGVTSVNDPRFAGCNFIPANRLSPVAQRLLAYLPAPQTAGNVNNYVSAPPFTSLFYKIDSKITWTPTSRLNVNARISGLHDDMNSAGLYGSNDNPLSLGTDLNAKIFSYSLAATMTLTPTLVMDVVGGATTPHTYQQPNGPQQCWADTVGIPNACQARDWALPQMEIAGFTSRGGTSGGTQPLGNNGFSSSVLDYNDGQSQVVANLGWTKGNHNVKFGGDMHWQRMNHYEISPLTSMRFTGIATSLNGGPAANSYNALADFLLGQISDNMSNAQVPPCLVADKCAPERPVTMREREMGFYVRDQWQIGQKLTASFGLRWEYYPVPVRADRGVEHFDLATNRVLMCGVAGNSDTCGVTVQKDLFTPRLGIAYRPFESFVIRAGYSRNPQNDHMYRGATYTYPASITITQAGLNSFQPAGTLETGYRVSPIPDYSSGSLALPAGARVITAPDHYIRGTITGFNVTAQKSFSRNMSVQVGYAGNRQRDMVRATNHNYGTIGGGAASQPFFQALGTTAEFSFLDPLGRVDYDSLQVSVNRRFADGLAFTAAYALAKGTDAWATGILIPEYRYLNEGPSSVVSPNKLDLSASYELPFGVGKRFLTDGVAAGIFGGWQVNAYFTAFSGSTMTMTSSGASLNAPNSPQRADEVAPFKVLGGVGPNSPWFDTASFAAVTQPRFGTSKANGYRGPGYANLDASLFRTFRFSQSATVQVRLEALNVTNTPHWANPGTNVNAIDFGRITFTANPGREYDERNLRLGVRLTF